MPDVKWSIGSGYGVVLKPTEVFLLMAYGGLKSLELNPILTHSEKTFHLVLNLNTGERGGYDDGKPDADLPFEPVEKQPATSPRVTELHLITKASPWVTTVRASKLEIGVTLKDIVEQLWEAYAGHSITESEWKSIPYREQEKVRRVAHAFHQTTGSQFPISPNMSPNNFRRADWLRDKSFFDGLEIDHEYSEKRLGFKAPNVFVMSFTA